MPDVYTWRTTEIRVGDCVELMRQMPERSVQCVVTSPPYWGLRDYGTGTWEGGDEGCDHKVGRFTTPHSEKQGSNAGSGDMQARAVCPKCGARRIDRQIGLEQTPEAYVAKMVEVFREVKRVLRDDGCCWLNLGDKMVKKQLLGLPFRLVLKLQSLGWYWRSTVIWSKPGPMPESAKDRPTLAHEYVFLLSKRARYFYDADAVRELPTASSISRSRYDRKADKTNKGLPTGADRQDGGLDYACGLNALPYTLHPNGRNLRTVWTIPTEPCKLAHFATFPRKLVKPCILASTSEKGCCPECGAPWRRLVEKERKATRPAKNNVNDETGKANRDPRRHVTESRTVGWQPGCECVYPGTYVDPPPLAPCTVLDPFCGRGTVLRVAYELGRKAIGLELNPEYAEMASKWVQNPDPLPVEDVSDQTMFEWSEQC